MPKKRDGHKNLTGMEFVKMAVGNALCLSEQLSSFENSSKYSLYLMITIAAYLSHVPAMFHIVFRPIFLFTPQFYVYILFYMKDYRLFMFECDGGGGLLFCPFGFPIRSAVKLSCKRITSDTFCCPF